MEDRDIVEIKRDQSGNILIDNNGNIMCESKEGTLFHLQYKDIDFTCDTVQCTVDNKIIFIKLHLEEPSNSCNENNNIDANYGQQDNYCQNENDANYGNATKADQDKREAMLWDDAKTKLFLQLYKENYNLLVNRKIKTKKVVWKKMTENMQTHGYNVTLVQVENKFKSLERCYKNMVTNNKKTGRARMSCPYERELTELWGHKHNIQPLAVSGKQGLLLREDVQKRTSLLTCNKVQEGQSTINLESEETLEPMTSNSTNIICDRINDSDIGNNIGIYIQTKGTK
ncbi:uncharacterized protein LOC116852095 isoform X2 [Odontomachus brunneus]|uniref:uncharacterized protein LOC116852095 isoform X2 n=1 Tax=Odontomachus brunneus TaxID=486640 RepID=UPI0013F231DC|nr:uncharacterized protein LOC116852095 isoform X2 [Odontomachus brunneus]